jgi:phage terminase small subunit
LGFTRKQRVFIDEYVTCWNGAEAARRAGYSTRSAREIAVRLLADDSIKAEIDDRLASIHMGSEEVLKEFADIARSDMGDFIDQNLCIDLADARKRGLTKLIKKIKQKTITSIGKKEDSEDKEITDIEIELYPRDKALEILGKYHGLFKEQVDITTDGKAITFIVKRENAEDDNPTP